MLLKADVTKDGKRIIVNECGEVIACVYRNFGSVEITAQMIVDHFNAQEKLLDEDFQKSQEETIKSFLVDGECGKRIVAIETISFEDRENDCRG
jgi:uncharacterized membrane protein